MLVCLLGLAGCAGSQLSDTPGATSSGKASYYSDQHQGARTASGERYDRSAMTAAHRTLAFGTRVRVTNLNNQRQAVVRINDRGPFTGGRVIDLSRAAAERIGMIRSGVVPVRLEVLK
ncbi:septal ring lytic transglycosylase RlpA family protein [Kushneria indalinina]|uniref:Endolytic peptidoglycan transglycosylase RlpA n=1 Tax=Kushneria indalinina DSM 14324 TaxID=1122140 RepID=A0A3D9DRP9_9GAMM|nr:septal ring lytic transglycosylase RlpA family protein [Kushneria indalinina]REC93438.1 rare lipoprotein A [Kushneria indalinina DSM 14324]